MTDAPVQRVLMTGDTVGGVWTFTLELARTLGGRGVEVLLAALGGTPTAEQTDEALRIPNLRLVSSSSKLEWMDDPWDDVAESGRWLLGLERQFAPDIVHLNSYGHGTLPWRAPVVITAHSCVLSWWAAVKREPLPASWARYHSEVALSLKSADLLAAPSRAMLQTVEENYGADLPPAVVIPNGRSPELFHAAPKEPLILSAGRLWDAAKNIAAIAQAAPRLPWPVYVAGEHRHPDGTPADLDPNATGCRFLGRLSTEALAPWYSRAAIYAAPARYEPFGLSALEAALSGCALVLGDIESLREVWGDAAIYVSPDSVEALEQALRDLIGDSARREEMSRRSLARAQSFTPERLALGYLEAYRRAAAGRRMACAS